MASNCNVNTAVELEARRSLMAPHSGASSSRSDQLHELSSDENRRLRSSKIGEAEVLETVRGLGTDPTVKLPLHPRGLALSIWAVETRLTLESQLVRPLRFSFRAASTHG